MQKAALHLLQSFSFIHNVRKRFCDGEDGNVCFLFALIGFVWIHLSGVFDTLKSASCTAFTLMVFSLFELNPSVDHVSLDCFVLFAERLFSCEIFQSKSAKKSEKRTESVFSSFLPHMLFFSFPNKPSKPQFIIKKYELCQRWFLRNKMFALVFCACSLVWVDFLFTPGKVKELSFHEKYVACSLFQMNLHGHTRCIKYTSVRHMKILEGKRSVFMSSPALSLLEPTSLSLPLSFRLIDLLFTDHSKHRRY